MIMNSEVAEEETLLTVAKLMVTAARTAPKTRGEDSIHTAIVTGVEKDNLAKTMEELGRGRDAGNVRASGAVVLIGVECGKPSEEWWPFWAKLIESRHSSGLSRKGR